MKNSDTMSLQPVSVDSRLPVCIHACSSVHLFGFLSVFPDVYLHVRLSVCPPLSLPVSVTLPASLSMSICLPPYLCLSIYLQYCQPVCQSVCSKDTPISWLSSTTSLLQRYLTSVSPFFSCQLVRLTICLCNTRDNKELYIAMACPWAEDIVESSKRTWPCNKSREKHTKSTYMYNKDT